MPGITQDCVAWDINDCGWLHHWSRQCIQCRWITEHSRDEMPEI